MSIEEHLQEFAGLPVFEFPGPGEEAAAGLPAAGAVAWRLQLTVTGHVYSPNFRYLLAESFEELLGRFLAAVDPAGVRALVIGWYRRAVDVPEIAELLAGAAGRLTGLRALFFGDLVREESDLSYIEGCDLAPLARAYPGLELLASRGSRTFGAVRHPALRALRFESGGLPRAVLAGVLASELPRLERLELWLGVDEYGGDIGLQDLQPLLAGRHFPALRHLGLEDSEQADELAAALAGAPVVARLSGLSLALGALSDEGAAALVGGQPLTHLERLDLHHHFLSEEMAERLRAVLEPAGVAVDLSDRQEPEEYDHEFWRYAANTE